MSREYRVDITLTERGHERLMSIRSRLAHRGILFHGNLITEETTPRELVIFAFAILDEVSHDACDQDGKPDRTVAEILKPFWKNKN